VLRWFARSGLIEPDDVRDMIAWENSGPSMADLGIITADHSRRGRCLSRPYAASHSAEANCLLIVLKQNLG